MKYHVNPETGKVSACRAKVKCRFGGATGVENHFDSKPAAEAAVEQAMSSKHEFGGLSKTSTSFKSTVRNIRAGMAKAGLPADNLPPVRSEAELVSKWFGGDRSKYELMARISNPGSHLTAKTKDSVSGFMRKGANVNLASTVDHLGKTRQNTPPAQSDVDLIDEMPGGKIDLEDLASGKLRAF